MTSIRTTGACTTRLGGTNIFLSAFDEGRYPSGGYSQPWTPHTVGMVRASDPPAPCTTLGGNGAAGGGAGGGSGGAGGGCGGAGMSSGAAACSLQYR